MKREKISLRGRAAHEIVKIGTSVPGIGQMIKNGAILSYPLELKWKCPKGFFVQKISMDHFDMELLASSKMKNGRAVLQLHGGGYIGKMKNIYRDFAVLYCKTSKGSAVLTIDYRVAPKHPYPAALEDAFFAYEYLLSMGYKEEQIVVAGDSAGGGLALALCLYLRDHGHKMPGGIITMSAWCDLTSQQTSYQSMYEQDALFGNTKDSMIFNPSYARTSDPKTPYISPIFGTFENFPPLLMQVGAREMLLDDTLVVARKAKMAQVAIRTSVYPGMFHVFQMVTRWMPESREAWREIALFFKQLAKD